MLCHLTSLSEIKVQWHIFSDRNALRKPSFLLDKPQSLKKTPTNHQDPIYSATTQVSSPTQLRGQFAIVQGQPEHLKMTLQRKNKENTKRRKKTSKIKPNQTPKPTLCWAIRRYCSQGPQTAVWELVWRLWHATVTRGMVKAHVCFCCLRIAKGQTQWQIQTACEKFPLLVWGVLTDQMATVSGVFNCSAWEYHPQSANHSSKGHLIPTVANRGWQMGTEIGKNELFFFGSATQHKLNS